MSRQRSGRGTSPPPAARGKPSTPRSGGAAPRARGVYVQAPKSDVYVVMLGISLGAILLACLFLFLVWSRYELKTKPTASLTSDRGMIAAKATTLPGPIA